MAKPIPATIEIVKNDNDVVTEVIFRYKDRNGNTKRLFLREGITKFTPEMHEQDCTLLINGGMLFKIVLPGNNEIDIGPISINDMQPITDPIPQISTQTDTTSPNPPNPNPQPHPHPRPNPNPHPPHNIQAYAPYNFVPLNDKVIPSEFKEANLPKHDRYDSTKNTGYIELKITTKTPLYIRDVKNVWDCTDSKPTSFFSPTGQPQIPGSSLRGMIRTLIEIVSFSKFTSVSDDDLYYRDLGKSFYKEQMLKSTSRGTEYITKSGFITKKGNKYYIHPAKQINGNNVYRVDFNPNTRHVNGSPFSLQEFEYKEVWFVPSNSSTHQDRHPRIPQRFQPYYALVKLIDDHKRDSSYVKGYLVSTGDLGTRKHMHWLMNEPDLAVSYEIPSSLIDSYNNDSQRDANADLIDQLRHRSIMPCFYIENNGKISSFGHTGLYRLKYRYGISDKIPRNLKNNGNPTLDIVETMFGNTENISSRIYFENAICNQSLSNIYQTELPQYAKILGSPKPTTYQHYLTQEKNRGDTKTWNDDNTFIRGYKIYWHKDVLNQWKETQQVNPETDTQHPLIHPIKPETHFIGRIRFENLSNIELGALLFVLSLPENHYHKIGMGKPLGLGSIQIEPTLFLSERSSKLREGRYSKLFDQDGNWFVGKEKTVQGLHEFKDSFQKYVLQELGVTAYSDLWNDERLKELKILLDWSNTSLPDWLEHTRYKRIQPYNEYRNRDVLPKPTDIKKLSEQ